MDLSTELARFAQPASTPLVLRWPALLAPTTAALATLPTIPTPTQPLHQTCCPQPLKLQPQVLLFPMLSVLPVTLTSASKTAPAPNALKASTPTVPLFA